MSTTTLSTLPRRQRGMSLVEILVAVAIGMVGLLVIFKTVAVWDTTTRTTTLGGDAQVAGTLAMFNLERDLKEAGMGFGTAATGNLGCTVVGVDAQTGRVLNFRMAPVVITPDPAYQPGVADRIDVLYGNSSFFVSEQRFDSSTTAAKRTQRRGGFKAGDVAVIAGNATPLPGSALCNLIEITSDANPDGRTIDHATGAYVNFYSGMASAPARFNAAAGTDPAFGSGAIYDLGPNPRRNTWQIANGRVLTRSDYLHAEGPFDVAEGVVAMRAQYGIDTNDDLRITDSGPNEWTSTLPANLDWRTVIAVRVGILVRSRQFERGRDPDARTATAAAPATSAVPFWAGGNFVMTNVDGTADSYGPTNDVPNNWRYYRYHVYQQVIPLRNMIWGTSP